MMHDVVTERLTEGQVWDEYYEVLASRGWTVGAFEALDDAGCSCCTPIRVIDADLDSDSDGPWIWVGEAQRCRFLLSRDSH